MPGLVSAPVLARLVPPLVTFLILFLSITPQYLFYHVPPADLTPFDHQYMCLWTLYIFVTYYFTVTITPGSYTFDLTTVSTPKEERTPEDFNDWNLPPGTSWCTRCALPKAPRAHHCRVCGTCIPRMDHHCPWTANCLSLRTMPSFLRFVLSATAGLWTLFYISWPRFVAVWNLMDQPAYLGPEMFHLGLLAALGVTNFITAICLSLITIQTLYNGFLNQTTIETWQQDRHSTLLEKRTWVPTSTGDKHLLRATHFPYDLNPFSNIRATLTTINPFLLPLPFHTPRNPPTLGPKSYDPTKKNQIWGWTYPENDLNQREGLWPPADPSRKPIGGWPAMRLEQDPAERWSAIEEGREAFRARQARDLQRWTTKASGVAGIGAAEVRRRIVDEDVDLLDAYGERSGSEDSYRPAAGSGPNRWTNADGETLQDYGVSESDQDDEDVPLAQLIARRKNKEL